MSIKRKDLHTLHQMIQQTKWVEIEKFFIHFWMLDYENPESKQQLKVLKRFYFEMYNAVSEPTNIHLIFAKHSLGYQLHLKEKDIPNHENPIIQKNILKVLGCKISEVNKERYSVTDIASMGIDTLFGFKMNNEYMNN